MVYYPLKTKVEVYYKTLYLATIKGESYGKFVNNLLAEHVHKHEKEIPVNFFDIIMKKKEGKDIMFSKDYAPDKSKEEIKNAEMHRYKRRYQQAKRDHDQKKRNSYDPESFIITWVKMINEILKKNDIKPITEKEFIQYIKI